MKKFSSIVLILMLVFTSSVFASDCNPKQRTIENEFGITITEHIGGNSDSIAPRTETIIFDDILNSANYTRSFTVSPSNGKNLNIFMSNSGNNSIEVDISIGGVSITGYPRIISPGKQHTYTSSSITYESDWELIINDRSGAKMSGEARARQFN